MKDKIIMQCFIPAALRNEIAKLQTEIRFKGGTKRASSISAIYIALVEAGVERHGIPIIVILPMPVDVMGRKRTNIQFTRETRQAIKRASSRKITQREMVNIFAWWGLESFTQYVHALPYADVPKPKQGRPRKQKHDLVN